MKAYDVSNTPKFIVKSTQLMSLLSGLALLPIFVIYLFKGNMTVALGTGAFSVIQIYCAFLIYRDKYHPYIGLLAIAPLMFVTSCYGIYALGVTASYWAFLSVFGFYFTLNIRIARLVNLAYLVCILFASYQALELDLFIRFSLGIVGISVFLYLCVYEIQSQHNSLAEMSITDVLTGLHNRSLLDHTLEKAIHQNQRSKIPMSLLMVDIDFFKLINDNYGHPVGDEVLKKVSAIMKDNFRKTDTLFRVGGEEFLILLSDSDLKNSGRVAERLRKAVEAAPIIAGHPVTISIGVSQLNKQSQWKDWMAECDKLLYFAKGNGRNQVAIA